MGIGEKTNRTLQEWWPGKVWGRGGFVMFLRMKIMRIDEINILLKFQSGTLIKFLWESVLV